MTDKEMLEFISDRINMIYQHFDSVKKFYEQMIRFYNEHATKRNHDQLVSAIAKREMLDEFLYSLYRFIKKR